MTKIFNIYQNQFDKATRDELNRIGWDEAAAKFSSVRTHLATSFKGSEGFEPTMSSDYSLVAWIRADGLEEVFAISNLQNRESRVTRVAPMHSLSVGDVVEDIVAGRYFMVDRMGFSEIEFRKAEVQTSGRFRPEMTEIRVELAAMDPGQPVTYDPYRIRVIRAGVELEDEFGGIMDAEIRATVESLVERYRDQGRRVFVNDHSGIDWTVEPF